MLKEQLERRVDILWVDRMSNICPWRKRFNLQWRKFWASRVNYDNFKPELHPDLDLIYQHKINNEIRTVGVELKYHKSKNRKGLVTQPYRGLEQALLLKIWGFDHVALWQVYDPKVNFSRLLNGAFWYSFYYREILELDIDFTFFSSDELGILNAYRMDGINGNLEIRSVGTLDSMNIQYTGHNSLREQGKELLKSLLETRIS